MPVVHKTSSIDEYFASIEAGKIILNDVNYGSKEDLERLKNSLYTIYDNDVIDTTPVCDCGLTRGKFLIGEKCEECLSLVKDGYDKRDPILWFERITEVGFISPDFWQRVNVVLNRYNKSPKLNINAMQWLSDPYYKFSKVPVHLLSLEAMEGFERDYVYMVKNLDKILEYISFSPKFRPNAKQVKIQELITEWREEKESKLSNFLPVPSKRMFVMENTAMGKYTNISPLSDVIDVVTNFIVGTSNDNITPKRLNALMSQTVSKLGANAEDFYRNFLGAKPGLFRKHIFGSRTHPSGRQVISAAIVPQDHETIHLSWGMAVTLYRLQIMNKLLKLGLRRVTGVILLDRALRKYCPVIHALIKELISESKYKGLPLLLQRNPTLLQGSFLRLFFTKVKTSVTDNTTTLPPMLASLLRGDFDGDEVNLTPLIDNFIADLSEVMAPYHSVPGFSKIGEISGVITITKPGVAILSNRLSKEVTTEGNYQTLQDLGVIVKEVEFG